jgi:TRAP-type C4-dicarboxylate transport system substrate-binding protein
LQLLAGYPTKQINKNRGEEMKIYQMGVKLLAAGVLFAGLAAPAAAKQVLTYTDGSSNRGARAEAVIWFADELSKRTNGELTMEMHWGGSLLKAKAAAKGVGAGAADMGFLIGLYNPKLQHAYTLGDYPTDYSDPWVLTRAMQELVLTNKDMKKEFDALNLKHIVNMTSTEIQLVCKDTVVKNLEDIKGKKVRGIGVYGKVFKDLGASPVRVSVYKAYQALDTGLIDCTQTYSYAIESFKMYEVAKEVTVLNWGALMALSVSMNKNTWEDLSDEHKKIIEKLSIDMIDHYTKTISSENAKALSNLKNGIDGIKSNVNVLPDAERNKLIAASASYLEDWKAKSKDLGIDGEQLIRDYQTLLRKYDEERKTRGYPWER